MFAARCALRLLLGLAPLGHLAALDLAAAEHFERTRHVADLVAVGSRRHREIGLARREAPHRVADRREAAHQPPLHVEHADASRHQDADSRHDQEQHAVAREVLDELLRAALHRFLGIADQHRDGAVERALDRDVLLDGPVGAFDGGQLAGAQREQAVVALAVDGQFVDRVLDLLAGDCLGGPGEQVGRGLEAVLQRHQGDRILRDGGFAQEARDQMGLRGDFERAAQACDLHRDEVLHQLAHPLHGVFALHHDVEIEVVDQPDQQIVEFLMCTENEGETRHLVLAVTRLEVHEVDEIAHAGLERLELLAGRHLGELPLGAARGRHEAVLQHRQDAGRGGQRARGEQPGEQIGLGADRDHRLHHLHAALDQRAHGDVAALADILGGGDHLEIAVVDDRGELVADLVVCGVQRGEPRIERVADFGALRDRLLERLEVFLQPLRHRLGEVKPAASACPTRSRSRMPSMSRERLAICAAISLRSSELLAAT